jgi:hypothetical protein
MSISHFVFFPLVSNIMATQTDPSSSSFELQSLPVENLVYKRAEEAGDFEETPPSSAVEVLQKWNSPRINMLRVFATFWSFFVTGMNDGSYGVSTSHISKLPKTDESRLWSRM